MKKRSIMVIIVIVSVMLFSITAVSFADVSGVNADDNNFYEEELVENVLLPDNAVIEDQKELTIEPYSNGITIVGSFKRKSGKGKANVRALLLGSTKMTSTVTLQEYSKAKGKYINSNAKSATLTVSRPVISQSVTFTVSSSKTYRIKITIKAKEGSSTYSKVSYRNLIAS